MEKKLIYSYDQIDTVVDLLYNKMATCSVFTFTGSLGAGKTALIKKLLARCGVTEVVTSPTFTLMAYYTNAQGQRFYHFDLYRLSSLADFREAGFEEYLYQPNSWAFIEWPSIVRPLCSHSACQVALEYVSSTERSLSLECDTATAHDKGSRSSL